MVLAAIMFAQAPEIKREFVEGAWREYAVEININQAEQEQTATFTARMTCLNKAPLGSKEKMRQVDIVYSNYRTVVAGREVRKAAFGTAFVPYGDSGLPDKLGLRGVSGGYALPMMALYLPESMKSGGRQNFERLELADQQWLAGSVYVSRFSADGPKWSMEAKILGGAGEPGKLTLSSTLDRSSLWPISSSGTLTTSDATAMMKITLVRSSTKG